MQATSDSVRPERLFNRTYILLFLINLIISISFAMITTTMSLYVTGLGYTAVVAGTVVGVFSIATLCMRFFSGLLSDRLNRKLLLLLTLGGTCVAMFGYGLTEDIPSLMVMRALHGISFAVSSTLTMALVAQTIPSSKMAQGMGYFAVGQTIALAVSPGLGMWLAAGYGFQVTFLVAAVIQIAAALMAVIAVPKQTQAKTVVHKLQLSSFIAREALPFALLAIAVSGASGIEMSFAPLRAKELGMANIGWYFTLGAVTLFVSRIGSGWFADRNARTATIAGFAAIILFYVTMGAATAQSAVLMFVLAAIFKALGQGSVQPLLQASCLKSVDASRQGSASCTYYLGADIGQAIAPIFGGGMVSAFGYPIMFYLFAAVMVIIVILYACLNRPPETRAAH